jgi:hypothetical protein
MVSGLICGGAKISLPCLWLRMNPYELFYVKRGETKVEGPYDLVKMGDLLLEKSITPETPVRVEGSLNWQPFKEYPQYVVVRETSVDAAARLESSEKKAEASAPLIPLPSRAWLTRLMARAVLLFFLGIIAYLIAWHNQAAGMVVLIFGFVITGIAQCLIFGQMLNEDFSTIGKVIFVPLYDDYYYGSNLDIYFSKFFVKYLGLTLVIAAAAGMGELHVHLRH